MNHMEPLTVRTIKKRLFPDNKQLGYNSLIVLW